MSYFLMEQKEVTFQKDENNCLCLVDVFFVDLDLFVPFCLVKFNWPLLIFN